MREGSRVDESHRGTPQVRTALYADGTRVVGCKSAFFYRAATADQKQRQGSQAFHTALGEILLISCDRSISITQSALHYSTFWSMPYNPKLDFVDYH